MNYNLKKLRLVLPVAMLVVGSLTACGDQPLFDEMAESRLRVVIKGTFESNNPKGWGTEMTAVDADGLEDTNSVNDLPFADVVSADIPPTKFMMDIAEFQIGKKRIGNYRQLFTADISAADTDPFFNGTGLELRNDDPPEESFGSVSMFIRKMIFNNATQYYLDSTGSWLPGDAVEVLFHENNVGGLDFNQLQVNSYYDSLLENADDINRVFPLDIPIDGGFVYDNNEEETVLEIRLVIKNFVKKYEYDFYNDDGYHALYHFYGLSDWLRDVKEDETNIGGNLFAVARMYVPGKTALISGTTPTAGYVLAIPSDKLITDYLIPNANRTRPLYGTDPTERYEAPKVPYLPVGTIESYLDYYLKYEQYKYEYNLYVNGVDDTGTTGVGDGDDYDSRWTAYDNAVSVFKLPPLVTWSNGGSYSITNIPIGSTYKVYFFSQANILTTYTSLSIYGLLPASNTTYSELTADLTVGDDTDVIFP